MESSFNLSAQTLDSIKDRKIILFDISVWNALADGKTNEAIVVRNILIDLVEKGLVFCPLTGPMLWELRKQAGCSFYRTTELMERLSLNIAFRRIDDISESEIRNYLRYLLNDEFEPLMGTLKKYRGLDNFREDFLSVE